MKSFLRNIKLFSVLFITVSLVFLTGLIWQQYRSQSELWVAAGENKNTLKAQYALAGGIYSRDMQILASSLRGGREYATDLELAQAGLQLIGDYTHIMANTVEAAYQAELLGNKRGFFKQIWLDFTGEGIRGDDLLLSLDSRLMKLAYQNLVGNRGSAVLLNYKTGEILAMVSTPSTIPENVVKYVDIPDTALLNRSINGLYSPGSTFKMITSAAYISSNIYDSKFSVDCTGQALLPGATKEIFGHGHGIVNLSDAFATSCNIYFGELGRNLGLAELTNMADKWGWNKVSNLDRLKVNSSLFTCPANDEALLTWAAIGQPVGEIIIQITPLQLALQAATIANNGVMPKPHLVMARREPDGKVHKLTDDSQLDENKVISEDVAKVEQDLMTGSVANGLVKGLAIEGFTLGAKSGTAEVDGQTASNGLISAYIQNDQYPLAVAVVIENNGFGSGLPLQIARRLLVSAIDLYPDGLMTE